MPNSRWPLAIRRSPFAVRRSLSIVCCKRSVVRHSAFGYREQHFFLIVKLK
jgi:hypothetical protein